MNVAYAWPDRKAVPPASGLFPGLSRFSEPIRARLAEATRHARLLPAGRVLFHVGEWRLQLIVSGWASQEVILADGRRQIYRLLLPGDFIGMPFDGTACRTSVVALTRLTLADASAIQAVANDPRSDPEVREVLLHIREQEVLALMAQTVRLGRLHANERMAHLLLEIHERMAHAGLAHAGRCPMPVSQDQLADLLGLSAVHVNRTLQTLRSSGLITLKGGVLTILDRGALEALGLHLAAA